ncbi:protein jagunal homolog 1-A-like [Corticium candelabrum]|uniref:protein jagunal homolog 1-A-like n=1 Tax=Corticium candelabrum TaxID=121492 RepID=UPI002E265030|nr:protein jagunal homolog 1-A-like [Corticium candelabrum]
MASRRGPRATGTDGSDFRHRQKVASQYSRIAQSKWRLRLMMTLHVSLVSCIVLHVVMVQNLREIEIWEWTWLVSCVACILGYRALKKNNVVMMKGFMVGVLLFGAISVSVGLFEMAVIRPVQMVQLFLLMFGMSAGFIHVLEMMTGKILLDAWSSKGDKSS